MLSPLGLNGSPASLDQRLPLFYRLIPLNPLPGFEEGWLAFDWLPLVHKDVAAPVRLDWIPVESEAIRPIRLSKPPIHDDNLVLGYYLLVVWCRSVCLGREAMWMILCWPWRWCRWQCCGGSGFGCWTEVVASGWGSHLAGNPSIDHLSQTAQQVCAKLQQ